MQKRARLLIESLSYQEIEKATEQLDEEHRPSKLDMECYIARFLGTVDIDWDARWVMSLLIQTKWDYEAAVQRYHNNSFPIEMLKDIADKRMLEVSL